MAGALASEDNNAIPTVCRDRVARRAQLSMQHLMSSSRRGSVGSPDRTSP